EQAHRSVVLAATAHLEATASWARRGRCGSARERTAGLLMAQFDHHTSREFRSTAPHPRLHLQSRPAARQQLGSDPQPRALQGAKGGRRDLPDALASELERRGIRLERQSNTFRVAAIPRDVERAFSKRPQAIEEAAHIHGYSTSWRHFGP